MKRKLGFAALLAFVCASVICWMESSLAQEAKPVTPNNLSSDLDRPKKVNGWAGYARYEEARPDKLGQTDHEHAESAARIVQQFQRSTDDSERGRLQEALAKVVAQQFEIRQQLRQRELEELEAQVKRLRDIHQRREREKDVIVRNRIQQLLRDADGLGWGGGSTEFNDLTRPYGGSEDVFPGLPLTVPSSEIPVPAARN